MRRAVWVLLAFVTACAPSVPPAWKTPPLAAAPTPSPAAGDSCRAGPDGEPTGGPQRTADRGIGGTGAPAAIQEADRGIGGTGIVGVVTGFGSICLGGREVAFTDEVPVAMDGAPASAAALRAGQLTAVEAGGTADALRARRIVIRHEVSGPVEAVDANGVLRVAGQRVIVGDRTWGRSANGAPPITVGDWLAVSGLREPGGEIDATRIDRRERGEVLVHGLLLAEGGKLRIGGLEIRPETRVFAAPGVSVTAVGRYGDGVLRADTLQPDLLLADPVAYFGPAVSLYVVEGYAAFADGRIRLGPRLDLRPPAGVAGFAPMRTVAEFHRGGDGSLAVTALRQSGFSRGAVRNLFAPDRGERFEPAPTPNHRFDQRAGGRDGRGGRDARRYGQGGQRRGDDAQPLGTGTAGGTPGPGGGGGGGGGNLSPGDSGDGGFRRR